MTSSTDQQPRPSFLRRWGSGLFSLILIALIIGTLATFLAKQHWVAEIFCHGRIQITIVLAICFLIAAFQKQKMRAFAALIFLVVNAVWIVPYFLPSSNARDNPTNVAASTIKIMSANVLTSNDQYSDFIQTVRQHDPDIAIVIEVNQRWKQEIEDELLSEYPHQMIIPKEHNFGIGIISKLPFSSVEQIIAEDTELISLDARFSGPSQRPFRLIATHPFPPLSQHCFLTRSQQLIELAQKFDSAEDNIITGDFNLTPWSPVFSEVLAAGKLKDSRVGFGVAPTWYAIPNFLGSLQIDHLLTSHSLTTIDHEVSENYGSDHRAIIVEILQPESPMTERPALPVAADTGSETDPESHVSIVYSPEYLIDLGGMEKAHPFDIRKYEKIYNGLLDDKLISATDVLKPEALSVEDLKLVHTDDYLQRLKERSNIADYLEAELLKLYPGSLDKAVLKPFRVASGGTLLAARRSLKTGIGVNIGGGYHHAKPDIGEGFCVYADVPIAIRKLQQEGVIKKALVIDVDVHQGNGTAECLADDDTTFTFSMHQGDIYPIPKSTSDRDVEMRDGDGDEQFLAVLEEHLDDIIETADADICFIVGGCDPLDGDPLASLTMTEQGIAERDWMIVDRCVKKKLPVVLTLSGGYSKNAWHSQYLSIKRLIETYGLASQ